MGCATSAPAIDEAIRQRRASVISPSLPSPYKIPRNQPPPHFPPLQPPPSQPPPSPTFSSAATPAPVYGQPVAYQSRAPAPTAGYGAYGVPAAGGMPGYGHSSNSTPGYGPGIRGASGERIVIVDRMRYYDDGDDMLIAGGIGFLGGILVTEAIDDDFW